MSTIEPLAQGETPALEATGGASPDTPASGGANPDQPGEPRDADQELLGIRKALSAARLEAKQRKADLDKAAAEIELVKQQMAEALQAKEVELSEFRAQIEKAELERATQALLEIHQVHQGFHHLVNLGTTLEQRQELAAAIGNRPHFVSPTPPGTPPAPNPSDIRRTVGSVPLF